MGRAGLGVVQALAPIPHERVVRAVVSIAHPEPLRYCLARFVRRNSIPTAAAALSAEALAAARILPLLLPFYWLFFRRSRS
jgi:hypothetical protein